MSASKISVKLPHRPTIRINSFKSLQKQINNPRKSISLNKLEHNMKHIQKLGKDDLSYYNKDIKRSFTVKRISDKSKDTKGSPKKHIKSNQSHSLSPIKKNIKQYQTFLKVSSQSWLVFDYRRDSYTRGWNVAEKGDFSGLIRFVLLKVYLELQKKNQAIPQYQARVNSDNLKQEIQLKKQQKKSFDQRKGKILREYKERCFIDNTIVKILDMIYGLFMTKFDDIAEHMVIVLGYLIHCCQHQIDPANDRQFFYVEQIPETITYKKYFADYVNKNIFPQLQMEDSRVKEHYFYSTPNDICRLYLSIEQQPVFREVVACKQIVWHIKYQIGFRYWQNRTMHIKNTRLDLGKQYYATFYWESRKQYACICRNTKYNVLIILGECRYGMTEPDIRLIEQWIRSTRKPVVDMRKTHIKLLPILRISKNEQDKQQSPQKTIKIQ